MNSQTDNQTDLAGLDFDIPCAVRWGSPDVEPCGHTAIADASFVDGHGNTVTRFVCAACLDVILKQRGVLSVRYI